MLQRGHKDRSRLGNTDRNWHCSSKQGERGDEGEIRGEDRERESDWGGDGWGVAREGKETQS